MDYNSKLIIISEGQKQGVSSTCKKYNISRTLYYRWLKKYKAFGIKGLNPNPKQFHPPNKTSMETEALILRLIKKHPHYGPREIKYIADGLNIILSESAVYNIMKRNNLNTKQKRLRYSKKKDIPINLKNPVQSSLNSGECWFFWTTSYGDFLNIGLLYEYTIYDYKSRLACTRLYNNLSIDNFEDILSAVAIPISHSLSMNPKHLCFLDDFKVKSLSLQSINQVLENNLFDISLFELSEKQSIDEINELRQNYTHGCLSYLMALLRKEESFQSIKSGLQSYVRNYNINNKQLYSEMHCSPIEYHIRLAKKDMILPLWAYIERDY